jgi:hypothetical protein
MRLRLSIFVKGSNFILMKAIEFKATIDKNKIIIPEEVQLQLNESGEDEIRVMLLIEEESAGSKFSQMGTAQFLEGYSKTDSVYDNYKVDG